MSYFCKKVQELSKSTPQTLVGPQEELTRFLNMEFADLAVDLLHWWREHEPIIPHLAKIARRYIFIPATRDFFQSRENLFEPKEAASSLQLLTKFYFEISFN